MKVIFLDIDGVLNCQNTFIKRYEKKKITGYYELEIDIDMIKCLRKIVKETNALIVLSSSWRIFFKYENGVLKAFKKGIKLIELLKQYGLSIYDLTPYDINRNRGIEIGEWLKNNKVSNYVILDDEENDLIDFTDHLVLCDFYKSGLTDELAELAISKLNCKQHVKFKKM